MQDTVITNAVVVLRDRVLENASVYIRNQLIQEVSQRAGFAARYAGARLVDAAGAYLLPGFIDIHSDNIETVIQPRPQSMIDFELAMREQEAAPGVRQDTGARLPSVSIRISPTVYWSGLRVRR